MRNEKRVSPKKLLFAMWPLILFYLISTVIGYGFMAVEFGRAGFAVLESEITQSGIFDYVLEQYFARSSEMIVYIDLIAAALFIWMYQRDLRRRGQIKPGQFQLMIDLQGLFWSIIGSIALGILCNSLMSMTPIMELSEIEQGNENMAAQGMQMLLLATALLAPVAEELMVRGLVYPRLKELISVPRAMLLSAMLFGMMHGNLAQGIYGFVMGYLFVWIYEKSGTIVLPMIAHMAVNLVVVCMGEVFASPAVVLAALMIASFLIFMRSIRGINCIRKLEN